MGQRVELWGTKITLKPHNSRATPTDLPSAMETPMDFSENERQHRVDVRRAVEMAERADARYRALGYADSREFSKEMKRRAIRRKYSVRYGAWLMKQLGL